MVRQSRFSVARRRPIVEFLEHRLFLSGSPTVTTIQPANGAAGIPRDSAVTADFFFPNGALDANTVTAGTVLLYRTSDHAAVPAVVNTTGGNDAVILQPSVLLEPNTGYTFQITPGVQDSTGVPVTPYTMSFTTGTGGATVDPSIAFQQIALPTAQGTAFSTVRVGPDHALWAGAEDGRIFRFAINSDGTLGTAHVISSLQTANGGPRLLTGFAFDPASTAANPILWVSNGAFTFVNAPDFSSKITRMSGPDLQTVRDVVTNLPRSVSDHLTDQPVFGPDGALYFEQAAQNSMGGQDIVWGNRPERLLSAAILRLDTAAAMALPQPLNAQTPDGGGSYDPNAPAAPLGIYASGVRNAYQLLWTRDGHLLAPVNGASGGGNTPTGPGVQGLKNVQQVESDYLYNVVQGGYYGHPNPVRQEYVLDGGNPTAGADPAEVSTYPVGTAPEANYHPPVFDFGLHRSPDGIIQYTGNAFGGALDGKILVAEYSAGDDIVVLDPGPNGTISSAAHNIAGFRGGFKNPVNLVEDPATGFLYVSELGANRITLLVPVPPHPSATISTNVMAFNSVATGNPGAGPSHTANITIGNTGTIPLSLTSVKILDDPSFPGDEAPAFKITNAPGSIAPGQSASISIVYRATKVGLQGALLQIQTNDAANPSFTVQLHGIGTAGQFGYLQPSLVQILRANNIPTIVGAGPNDADINNSQYPVTPDPSSTEVLMPRLVKAGAGPVTITALGAFNVGVQPSMRLGVYAPGDPTDRHELFFVNQSDAQTVNPTPQGATSFDPDGVPFGIYAVYPGVSTPDGTPDIHYTEDALNTLDPTHPRKFRFFPLRGADGAVVPDAYVVAAEDFNSPTYNSFVNFVGIIRNVKPAAGAVGAPVLGLTNLDGAPSNTRMVFNRIQNLNPANPAGFVDRVKDTGVLQINNTGDQPLVVSALTLSDPSAWAIDDPPNLPATIAPGGTLALTVHFIATTNPAHADNQTNSNQTINGIPATDAGGVWSGTLTITSNDPVHHTRAVQLAGYWQNTSENENEPGLQTIINGLFGYQTNISSTARPQFPNTATPVYYGEEVISGLWSAADTSLPVSVRQLAAYHNQYDADTGNPTAAMIGWYPQGNTNPRWIFQDATANGQSLFPLLASGAPAAGSFNPGGAFGWNVDGENSQDALNTTDINTFGRSGHAVRFYPVRDAAGNIVPNDWLIVMDYEAGKFDNSDYQDLIYLVHNMRPAAAPPTPADVFASPAASGGVLLQWAPATYTGSVGYDVYRASAPNGPFVKINPASSPATSFTDLNAPVGVITYYRVVAVDLTTGAQSPAVSAATAAISTGALPTGLPAPSNLTATATSKSSITLTWTPSPGASDYRIERLGPADEVFREIATGVTGNSFTDTGLDAGANYQYRVRAENDGGTSAYSVVASATTLTSDSGDGGGDGGTGGGGTGGGPTPVTVTKDFGTILKGSRRLKGSLLARAAGPVYSFTITRLSRVVLHLAGLKFNADLALVDADGNSIALSHRPGKKAEAISLKLDAGTYYIEPALVDSTTTPFTLQFSVNPVKVKKPKAQLRNDTEMFSDIGIER